MDASLSIRQLTKQFEGHRALKGIDLEIPAGRLLVLLRPLRLRQDHAAALDLRHHRADLG